MIQLDPPIPVTTPKDEGFAQLVMDYGVGALVGLGIPEFEAKRYNARIREGNILISVHTEDSKQCDMAKEVFKRNHAEDISSASEASVK